MFFMTFYLENVHGLDPVAAGMHTAFLVAAAVALVGAVIALLVRPGEASEEPHPAI
jgi:hypothetical protein